MTEDARWDYRATIRFPNSTLATTANPDEDRLIQAQSREPAGTLDRPAQPRFTHTGDARILINEPIC
jgi:hypothetical protein